MSISTGSCTHPHRNTTEYLLCKQVPKTCLDLLDIDRTFALTQLWHHRAFGVARWMTSCLATAEYPDKIKGDILESPDLRVLKRECVGWRTFWPPSGAHTKGGNILTLAVRNGAEPAGRGGAFEPPLTSYAIYLIVFFPNASGQPAGQHGSRTLALAQKHKPELETWQEQTLPKTKTAHFRNFRSEVKK